MPLTMKRKNIFQLKTGRAARLFDYRGGLGTTRINIAKFYCHLGPIVVDTTFYRPNRATPIVARASSILTHARAGAYQRVFQAAPLTSSQHMTLL